MIYLIAHKHASEFLEQTRAEPSAELLVRTHARYLTHDRAAISLVIAQAAVMRMDVAFRKLDILPMQRGGIRLHLAHHSHDV